MEDPSWHKKCQCEVPKPGQRSMNLRKEKHTLLTGELRRVWRLHKDYTDAGCVGGPILWGFIH